MAQREMVVHESVEGVPSGFALNGPAAPTQELTLRIALAQTNIAGLQERTLAVSDPANALYGKHLTREEVSEFTKPMPETLSAVSSWLSENGIAWKGVSSAGDMLQIALPVRKADELLAARFSQFTHVASGTTSIRTLAYSVPVDLQTHIQFVHPTVAFVPPLRGGPKRVRAEDE